MECAHKPCTCRVLEPGETCSETCEQTTMSGEFCGCEHAVCETSRMRALVAD